MNKSFWKPQVFTFLTLLMIGTSCNGQVKNDLTKENLSDSRVKSVNQQKLIRTQSLNKGDNVHCSLQDKAGNLWFGTTADGIYKYDGKLFSQFTTTNGLNSNNVSCILEVVKDALQKDNTVISPTVYSDVL